MAKVKVEKEKPVQKEQTKEVVGIIEAEKLQKEDNGWDLVEVVKLAPDKEGLTVKKYKFRKEEK